jgi:signal transduction histidine kinase
MKDAAAGILGGTNCHFALPPDPSVQVLNLDVKHNLYLIYKEIITNIARHAKAKEVVVILATTGRSLMLTVSDDGAGFDTTREMRGMGLKNLAARAAAIGGVLETTSSPGKGTKTTVIVPFT